MNWLDSMIDDYYNWLRERTIVEAGNSDWYCIDTPFMGAFNDSIEVYALRKNGTIVLSDNGETLNNLELQGFTIQGSRKRREILDNIILSYGLNQKEKELQIEANERNFPQKKHNFLSAILEINDLAVLSKHNVSSIFKEDVRRYLDDLEITYTPEFISKGSTGLEFTFDFQIAKREKEIVLKSFNSINKSTLSTFLFSWEDIKPVREKITKKEVKAIAVINDLDKEVHPEYLEALKLRMQISYFGQIEKIMSLSLKLQLDAIIDYLRPTTLHDQV